MLSSTAAQAVTRESICRLEFRAIFYRATLEIDLRAQGWIEIVGASQDRLVLVTGVNGA